LKKIIVTGANGVGKSHLAARLAVVRPDVPVISFDAIKLRTNWQQKSRLEIDAALDVEIEKEAWILEGGPSLLSKAITRADAVIWLDPPEYVRAWRLAIRPWKYLGQTRPEIPEGNVDWPIQQYRFALRSLKNRARIRSHISDILRETDSVIKWRCRDQRSITSVIDQWSNGAS
jgi:adenylate kinase family enzyme